MSTSTNQQPPKSMVCFHKARSAWCADRPGRKPYEQSRKSVHLTGIEISQHQHGAGGDAVREFLNRLLEVHQGVLGAAFVQSDLAPPEPYFRFGSAQSGGLIQRLLGLGEFPAHGGHRRPLQGRAALSLAALLLK